MFLNKTQKKEVDYDLLPFLNLNRLYVVPVYMSLHRELLFKSPNVLKPAKQVNP
jgi:hypothetical protein